MLLFECSNNKWHRCIIPFFDTTRSQTKRWNFLLFNFIKSLTLICFEISNICGILEDLWTQMRKFSFLIFEYYDCNGRIRNLSLRGLNKKKMMIRNFFPLYILYTMDGNITQLNIRTKYFITQSVLQKIDENRRI